MTRLLRVRELQFLLDELGQTEVVAEAASVREAIEKLKEYPCDVMFLDVNMPEATGYPAGRGAAAPQVSRLPWCSSPRTASSPSTRSR